MKLHEYISNVLEFVFSSWIDIPLEFEFMVEIVATQFFYHNIALDECCRFAELIINIHTEGEFDFVFEYEPFNVLDDELSSDFVYEIDSTVNPESFVIIIDGEKRIDVHYKENLSYQDLVEKVKEQDLPST